MGNLKGGNFSKQIKNALIRLDARGQGRYKTDSRKTHSNALMKKREMYLKDFARFVKKIKKMWRDATADITKELEMEEMKEEIKKHKDELNKLQNETKIDINPVDSLNSRDMKDFLK